MTNSTAQLILWCRSYLFGSILISWGREVSSASISWSPNMCSHLGNKDKEEDMALSEATLRLATALLWGMWRVLHGNGLGPSNWAAPNTDPPIGRHSSKVYLWDRKDSTFKTISLALPQLLLRTRIIIIITAHICGTFTVYLVLCYIYDLTD